MRVSLFSICILFSCVLIFSSVQTADAGSGKNSASGTLTLNKAKIKLVHAYADMVNPEEPVIVISDKPLPADDFSISLLSEGFIRDKKVHAIVFSISRKEKKLTDSIRFLYFPGKKTHFTALGDAAVLNIRRLDDTVIEGKITTPKPVADDFFEVSFSFDASFHVSLSKSAAKSVPQKVTVTGDTSPSAKAYAEYYRACIKGDIDKIRSFMHSKIRDEFDAYDKEMREAMIYALQHMRPTGINISKPSVTAEYASFIVKGSLKYGEKATGSVRMILEEGQWKVLEDKWDVIAAK